MAEGVSSRRRAATARPQGPAPMMRTSRMSGKEEDEDDCGEVVLPTMSGWCVVCMVEVGMMVEAS